MGQRPEPALGGLGSTERAYASLPLSPAWVGVGVAGALVTAFVGSELALGRHLLIAGLEDPTLALSTARIAVVHCLLVAYLPTAYVSLLQGARSTFAELRSRFDWRDSEEAEVGARIGRYSRLALVLSGLFGFGMVLWITRLATPPEFDPWAFDLLDPEPRWHRVGKGAECRSGPILRKCGPPPGSGIRPACEPPERVLGDR